MFDKLNSQLMFTTLQKFEKVRPKNTSKNSPKILFRRNQDLNPVPPEPLSIKMNQNSITNFKLYICTYLHRGNVVL
jgi:hypothetical protein